MPLNAPLPSGMGATILDTLYVPDANEKTLDFVLNLYTANFSNAFISSLQQRSLSLYNDIMEIVNYGIFVTYNSSGGLIIASGLPGGIHRTPAEFMRDNTGDMETDVIPGNWSPTISTAGRITFEENSLGVNEGIRGLSVIAIRFFPFLGNTSTDVNGNFSSSLISYSNVSLVYNFENSILKIISIDFSSGSAITLSIIRHLFLSGISANHIELVSPFENVNNISVHFNHGGKKALWGITFNGVQEGYNYAFTDGLLGLPKKLNVACHYTNSLNPMSSAPMLGYIGAGFGVGITNIIFHTLGKPMYIDEHINGMLPDMIISGSSIIPGNCNDRRTTIYHEYGHTLHYFKANQFSNAHWLENISETIEHQRNSITTDDYGSVINASPGNFFALSEGWADFIGNNYASRKYPAPRTFWEGVRNTERTAWIYSANATYLQHLENNPTFFNSFIPRGLFHDLMDGGIAENDFDRISGHTILQIYNRFNDATWTIQKFRERWEDAYPSINNADLFERYNIDLP